MLKQQKHHEVQKQNGTEVPFVSYLNIRDKLLSGQA